MAHGAHGRPVSWIAVVIICIGFTIAGVALCMDPTWWLFWTGAGVFAVGSVLGAATNMMEDYTT